MSPWAAVPGYGDFANDNGLTQREIDFLVSWAESYQGAPHVVFGHNAQAGLQLFGAATGLDTGCVYGGQLSAMVLKDGQNPPPPAERRDVIVSVEARERYVEYGPRPERHS